MPYSIAASYAKPFASVSVTKLDDISEKFCLTYICTLRPRSASKSSKYYMFKGYWLQQSHKYSQLHCHTHSHNFLFGFSLIIIVTYSPWIVWYYLWLLLMQWEYYSPQKISFRPTWRFIFPRIVHWKCCERAVAHVQMLRPQKNLSFSACGCSLLLCDYSHHWWHDAHTLQLMQFKNVKSNTTMPTDWCINAFEI